MSLQLRQQFSLKPYNSLALTGCAEYFCTVSNLDELEEALAFARANKLRVTPLGGGSNIVLAGDIAGLVIQVNLKGINGEAQSKGMRVSLGAGENWHQTVLKTLEQGWYGIENLSLIPGLVGAAPIQNIGAYGVELCDVFDSLQAVEITTGEIVHLSSDDCQFGYRDSVFKRELRDQYLITQVNLNLLTTPKINLTYPALKEVLERTEDTITPARVSEAVCQIRQSKLPDPEQIPNAGSFFKNPVICKEQVDVLRQRFPTMPVYPQPDGQSKIAAGWLIEQCGLKGCRNNNVGVHEKQALVLINFGGATGQELLALAKEIQKTVEQTFAISLEIEPRVYSG